MTIQQITVNTRRRDKTEQEQLARALNLAFAIKDDSDLNPIIAWLTLSKSLSIEKITLVHVCVPPWANEVPASISKGKRMLAKMNTQISEAANLLENCRSLIQELRPNLDIEICLECGDIRQILPNLVKTKEIDQLIVFENIYKKSWWRTKMTIVRQLTDSCPCVVIALPSLAQ